MISTKYFKFSDFAEPHENFDMQVQNGFMKLYEKASRKVAPVIVELGTNKGMSTTVFLQAATETRGRVFSVDINNEYSDLTSAKEWTFVHSDSTDADGIATKFPEIKNGVDILLIDSLHKRFHVEREFYNWWPYLNQGAIIIFDDIDSHHYRRNGAKNSATSEFDWTDIRNFVEETFFANEDKLLIEIHLGSTGFAMMTKMCPRTQPISKRFMAPARSNSVSGLLRLKITKALSTLKRRSGKA